MGIYNFTGAHLECTKTDRTFPAEGRLDFKQDWVPSDAVKEILDGGDEIIVDVTYSNYQGAPDGLLVPVNPIWDSGNRTFVIEGLRSINARWPEWLPTPPVGIHKGFDKLISRVVYLGTLKGLPVGSISHTLDQVRETTSTNTLAVLLVNPLELDRYVVNLLDRVVE